MKVLIAIAFVFTIITNTALGQNFVRNSTFDDYKTFLDSNNNIVYQPQYWIYSNNKPNHPIYVSSARVLNKTLRNNFHPEADKIMQGQLINYISVLVLPNTQKAFTELIEPLQAGQKYQIQIDIKIFSQSNCISDLLVGFMDSLKMMDTCMYKIRLPIPDTASFDYFFKNWLTIRNEFVAKGNEKVFVISAGNPNDYLKIIQSNPFKYIVSGYYGNCKLKYFVDNIRLSQIYNNVKMEENRLNLKSFDSLNIGEKHYFTKYLF